MCISACSSSIGSWTTSTIPILYRYLRREMVSLCKHKKMKGMVEPEQKATPYKDLRAPAIDNIMHLVEERGYSVLRIVSQRGNHYSWHLLSSETSGRRNPRNMTNKIAWSDTSPRLRPSVLCQPDKKAYTGVGFAASTLLTWSCVLTSSDYHLFRARGNRVVLSWSRQAMFEAHFHPERKFLEGCSIERGNGENLRAQDQVNKLGTEWLPNPTPV